MEIAVRKWVKVCMILFAMTLSLFLASCGGKTEATFNIAGTWSVFSITDSITPATEQREIFSFTTSDNDVGGTNTSTTPNEPVTGSVSGKDVNFSTSGANGTKNYTGQLSTEGATMTGTWTSTDTSGKPGPSGRWSAVVHVNPTFAISGSGGWSLTEPAAGFGAVQSFTFQQSVNDLTDLNGSTTAPEVNPITGSLGSLDIIFFWTGSDGVIITLTGKINGGNIMSGTWTDSNVPPNSGTWTAKKIDAVI